jgi:flagellar biosynthesis/type III secretory pathway protein FliH
VQRFEAAFFHARFFALAARHATVAGMTRTRFDEFGKQLVRAALEDRGSVKIDVEVPADTHRIDLWITPTDPTLQSNDDQAMNTQDIVETWRREAIQEGVKQGLEQGVKQGLEQGVKQGLEQGERRLLLQLLRRRFGAQVDGETERRIAAASAEQVELWAERVLSAATLAELLAD